MPSQVKEFQLTKGFTTIVDEEDVDRISCVRWHVLHARMGKGSIYARGTVEGRKVLLHRFIMSAPKGVQIDHIDGNGLNNTKANLRFCNQSENSRNMKPKRHLAHGFKGVWKEYDKWVACIHVVGVGKLRLGLFDSPDKAALAYNEAARLHFGEFARLNEGING